MKTLRIALNIAVLFILVMGWVALRPSVSLSHAAKGQVCGFKPGYTCTISHDGNCHEQKCKTGAQVCTAGCVPAF